MNPRLKMRGALIGAVVALTFALTWSLVKVPSLEDQASKSAAKVGQLEPQVQTLNENQQKLISGMAEANRRLVALGKTPVPVPSVAPTTPLPQPDQFTAEEAAAVRVIVADLIARQKVQITQAEISQIARVAAAMVPKPKDGRTPTPAEVQRIVTVALAAYCVGDKCVGKPGADGRQGPSGPAGKDAPEVTDQELLEAAQTALASYCAQDSQPCKGDVGPQGPQGPQGERGRGITSGPTCQEDGTWRTTYSDGSSETQPGPCRLPVPSNEGTGN